MISSINNNKRKPCEPFSVIRTLERDFENCCHPGCCIIYMRHKVFDLLSQTIMNRIEAIESKVSQTMNKIEAIESKVSQTMNEIEAIESKVSQLSRETGGGIRVLDADGGGGSHCTSSGQKRSGTI